MYNFSVLKELGDEAEVKAKGKILTKGKDYVIEDGDIILIKAGAAKGSLNEIFFKAVVLLMRCVIVLNGTLMSYASKCWWELLTDI